MQIKIKYRPNQRRMAAELNVVGVEDGECCFCHKVGHKEGSVPNLNDLEVGLKVTRINHQMNRKCKKRRRRYPKRAQLVFLALDVSR